MRSQPVGATVSDFVIQYHKPGGIMEFEYNPELNQAETIENFIDQLDLLEPGQNMTISVHRVVDTDL